MTVHTTTLEHQRLMEVAREYRKRGYHVIIEPRSEELPTFLASFQIDMLAQSVEENVIIEVRTQESLTHVPELDAIAQAIENEPSWRFELIVTNPKDRSLLQFKGATSLDLSDIIYRLSEARQLSDQEHGEAALLLAWSATEALLRSIADKEAISISRGTIDLVKSLFTYGVLDKEQYQILREGSQARNTVSHGYQEQSSLVNTLEQVLSVANQLVKRYSSS